MTHYVWIQLEASSGQTLICIGREDNLIPAGAQQGQSDGLLSMRLPDSTAASQAPLMCVCVFVKLLNKSNASGSSKAAGATLSC